MEDPEQLKDRWNLRLLVLKRKVWWPQKDEKEKKESWKFVGPRGNWTRVSCMKCKSADHYTIQTLLKSRVDQSKVSYEMKAHIFTNPSLTQIEIIDIGHKSLPIIIGP